MNNLFLILLFITSGASASEAFKDYMVQSPKIEAPKRGSLKGEYGSVGLKSLNLQTGSFSTSLPFVFPSKRGKMLQSFGVTYSPSFGLSEFGIGWSSNLKISRVRDLGVLNFTDDNLSTPWGKMLRGDSGFYYTEKVEKRVKLELLDREIVVYLSDGSKVFFGDLNDDAYFDEIKQGQVVSWSLNYAVDPVGVKTKYNYSKRTNKHESYLREILYGGLAEDYQYKIVFNSKINQFKFESFKAAKRTIQDEYIDEILIQVKENSNFVDIYKYKLNYKFYTNSPGFHLVDVQKIYNTNNKEPKITFNYDSPSDFLKNTKWQENPNLSDLAQRYRTRLTNYNFTSMQDFNNDGRVDLELGQEYDIYHNTDDGFEKQELDSATGDISTWCLFPVHASRNSRRFFRPTPDSDVFVYDLFKYNSGTIFDLCKLNGERVDYFLFPQFWEKGLKTIISDVNRDLRPDVIHLRHNAYEVIYNTSTKNNVSFSQETKLVPINLPTTFHSFWVNDINSDGHPDLVLKGHYSIYAHMGDASGEFSKEYISFNVYLPNWVPSSIDLKDRSVSFVDMNKDSLPDMLVQYQGIVSLFINTGNSFLQYYIPGMFVGPSYNQNIIYGDMTGDGNQELITTLVGTNKVLTLPLDKTGLGLLKSMNDGKGNFIEYTYGKSKAQVGVGSRKTIITEMKRTTIGEEPVEFSLNFGEIATHSETKGFLGFKAVNSLKDQIGVNESLFIYDSKNRSYITESSQFDTRVPGFIKYSQSSFIQDVFDGLDITLLTESNSGYRDLDGNDSNLKNTTIYNQDLCIETTRKESVNKFLETTKSFQTVAGFEDNMSCFDDLVTISGNNFSYNLDIDRDSAARVTHIKRGGYLQQQMSYGLNGKLSSIWNTGKGATSVNYDQYYRINSVIAPDGVETAISEYEIINDNPKNISKIRPNLIFEQYFRFDGIGRLSKLWHNLGNYSESVPYKSYAYEFADDEHLAATKEVESINYSGSSLSSIDRFFWQTGAGKDIANGQVDQSNIVVKNQYKYLTKINSKIGYRSNAIANNKDFLKVKPQDLPNPFEVMLQDMDYLNLPIENNTAVFSSINQKKEFTRNIQNNKVRDVIIENGDNSLRTVSVKDSFGHLVRSKLEEGNVYKYRHDGLGRLKKVIFPDGTEQRVRYHQTLGYVKKVIRDGIGSINYIYELDTNLLKEKIVSDQYDFPKYKTEFEHDSIGRVIKQTHTNFKNNGNVDKTYEIDFLFDGNYFNKPQDSSQLGFLTAIQSNKFTKEYVYSADEKKVVCDQYVGNKKLTKNISYFDHREPSSEEYIFSRASNGNVYTQRVFDYALSAVNGQVESVLVDGSPFYSYVFDNLLEVNGAAFNGNFINFTRDLDTNRVHGISENGMGRLWSYNNRDLIDQMDLDFGTSQVSKTYSYNPNKYLESLTEVNSQSATKNYSYLYDINGLISNSTLDGDSTDHERLIDQWKVGSYRFILDDMGRVQRRRKSQQISPKRFTYGATGRISKVKQRNRDRAYYFYDEENNPIVKEYKNGQIEFYFEDLVIKGNKLYQPVKLNSMNHALGYFNGADFKKIDADHLGSVIRDSNNRIRLPSPYGERTKNRNLKDHDVFDFTLKGYDRDIEAVRMGRRYYDPKAKLFLTPDFYFIENFDKIKGSPVEGNLYSYAGNNPINYTDPSGKNLIAKGLKLLYNAGKAVFNAGKRLARYKKNDKLYQSQRTSSKTAGNLGKTSKKTQNKVNHIFGPKNLKRHKLDKLLDKYKGDGVKAYRDLKSAASRSSKKLKDGVHDVDVTLKGESITVRVFKAKGKTEVSTAFGK